MTLGENGIQNHGFNSDETQICKNGKNNLIADIEMCGSIKNESIKASEIDKNEEIETIFYHGKKLKFNGYIMIISLASSIFASCSSWALLAPFYPRVAESKGLTLKQYSLIFTIYEINKIFLPPLYSKLAIKMTPKYLLLASILIVGWCSCIFGFLEYAKKGQQFFILCLIVRIVWSFGGAGAITCANIIGILLFPNHVATVYAAIEIGAGLGFIISPYFGGVLFEMGGFSLPFLFTSILAFISMVPIAILVKNELRPKDKNQVEKSTTVIQCIKIPGISINLIMSTVTCLSIGFNDSTLDHHLREIDPNISPSNVGKIFLITGLLYTICTWGYGRIAEKWVNSYYFIFLGCFLIFVSFIFVGPLPFLPLEPSIWCVIISQSAFGIGMGALFVLSFDDCVKQGKKYLPDNDSTMAVISGLYTSSYAIGNALGPFIGGQFIDRIGYRNTTVPIACIIILSTILVAIYVFKIKK